MANMQQNGKQHNMEVQPEVYNILLVGDKGIGKDSLLRLWMLKYPVDGENSRYWFQGFDPSRPSAQPRKRFTVMTTDEKHWTYYPVPDLVIFCYAYGSTNSLVNVFGHHRNIRRVWPSFRQKSQVALIGLANATARIPPIKSYLQDELVQGGSNGDYVHWFAEALRVDIQGVVPYAHDRYALHMWNQTINHLMIHACNAFHWRPNGCNLRLRQNGVTCPKNFIVRCGTPGNFKNLGFYTLVGPVACIRMVVGFLLLLQHVCPTSPKVSLIRLLDLVAQAVSVHNMPAESRENPAFLLKKILESRLKIPFEEARRVQDINAVLEYAESILKYAQKKTHDKQIHHGVCYLRQPIIPQPEEPASTDSGIAGGLAGGLAGLMGLAANNPPAASVPFPKMTASEWPMIGIKSDVLAEMRRNQWYNPYQPADPIPVPYPSHLLSEDNYNDPYLLWGCRWEFDALFDKKRPWYDY